MTSVISLMNNKNNKGPKFDPCGTPDITWEELNQKYNLNYVQ